jgi:Uma2 family endonuclease
MTVEQKLMTADELMRLPRDGCRHELVVGELRTMPPASWGHGDETSVIDGSLGPYVRQNRLGRVLAGDPGFLLTSEPDTVRAPDVAFISRERIPAGLSRRGYFPGAPDLAVEVISPNDLYTDVDEKVGEWLEHGTRLVFVVNPRRQTVAVHRPGQPVRILTVEDTMDGEDVVPGWSLAVRDLFDEP